MILGILGLLAAIVLQYWRGFPETSRGSEEQVVISAGLGQCGISLLRGRRAEVDIDSNCCKADVNLSQGGFCRQ